MILLLPLAIPNTNGSYYTAAIKIKEDKNSYLSEKRPVA
jgi:hypothetical protein